MANPKGSIGVKETTIKDLEVGPPPVTGRVREAAGQIATQVFKNDSGRSENLGIDGLGRLEAREAYVKPLYAEIDELVRAAHGVGIGPGVSGEFGGDKKNAGDAAAAPAGEFAKGDLGEPAGNAVTAASDYGFDEFDGNHGERPGHGEAPPRPNTKASAKAISAKSLKVHGKPVKGQSSATKGDFGPAKKLDDDRDSDSYGRTQEVDD